VRGDGAVNWTLFLLQAALNRLILAITSNRFAEALSKTDVDGDFQESNQINSDRPRAPGLIQSISRPLTLACFQ
jgi:hypothetical protein